MRRMARRRETPRSAALPLPPLALGLLMALLVGAFGVAIDWQLTGRLAVFVAGQSMLMSAFGVAIGRQERNRHRQVD